MSVIVDWLWFVPVALLAGIAAAGLLYGGWRRRRSRLAAFASDVMLPRLAPPSAFKRPVGRAVRLGSVVLLAGLALAGPRWGEERTLVRGEGVDLVLALDASLSMLATDERPNRLEAMKQEVRRFRAQSTGDRIALLAFAGRSYILTPLTVDDGALELFLDNLDPSIVGQAGSSLARTISQGVELLEAVESGSDRAIIVMSDGEAFEPVEDVVQAATRAREAQVALVTVGFGTEEGSTIPLREGDKIVPKRDDQGAVVITKYHPEMLDAAARAAGGTFIEAGASDKASRIRGALQSLRTTGRAVQGGREYVRRFQSFLIPALVLLLLDTWLAERRRALPRLTRVSPPADGAEPSGAGTPAATTSSTAAVLAILCVSMMSCAWTGEYARKGASAFRQGEFAQSAALYRYTVDRGDRRPEMLYNLGTALVAADSLDASLEPLERALRAEDEETRFRALFNFGLAYLHKGLAGDPGADSTRLALRGARDAYKRALLMRPDDVDAKWNYELALRKEESAGGGGGGGGASQNNAAQQPDSPQQDQPSGGLGEQQAEQLLNAAAREERGVQGRKQQQSRRPPPTGGRDW